MLYKNVSLKVDLLSLILLLTHANSSSYLPFEAFFNDFEGIGYLKDYSLSNKIEVKIRNLPCNELIVDMDLLKNKNNFESEFHYGIILPIKYPTDENGRPRGTYSCVK